MSKKRKILTTVSALAAVCLAIVAFAACGSKKDEGGGKDSSGGKAGSGSDGKKTEIVVWHIWDESTVSTMYKIAEEFNENSKDYEVSLLSTSSSAYIRRKLATLDQKEFPAMFCGVPYATCYQAGIGYVKPIQDFLDADDDNWDEAIFPNVKAAYSDLDGRMIGFPIGVSSAGFFVNNDILKSAGYSIDQLDTYEKIVNAAIDIHKQGKAKYGISFNCKNVEIMDLLALQGTDMLDQKNGRGGTVTKSLLSEGETGSSVKKITNLVASAYKAGAGFVGSNNYQAFYAGDLAFCAGTNSNIVLFYESMGGGMKFDWTFVPYSGIDGGAKYKDAALCEGTGVFITDSGDEKTMQGAYEFLKYLARPENQSLWCRQLGYVPYTQEALDDADFVKWANDTCPALLELARKIKDAPGDLALPYTYACDYIYDATSKLYDSLTTEPRGDLDSYIKEMTTAVDRGIKRTSPMYGQ